jgi:phospho-N-acetylmuramoyl-pentapeptide-transferase
MVTSFAYALVAFALGVFVGPRWLKFLKSQQIGKQVNPSEPEEQKEKEGTPTMGGAVFIVPIVAVTLAFQFFPSRRLIVLVPMLFLLGLTALGALDDKQTLIGRERSAGMSPAVKWAAQIVMCLAVAAALAWYGVTQVHIPFAGSFDLPLWAYIPFATFVLLATTNSVAITDGMDSLLGTTSAIAFVAFWVIGWHLDYPISVGLCATVVGALVAYLWFNAYPAQMWMGDTGSLPLGGLLGVVALMEREPVLLIPIGVIFVANAAGDILQVATNKLTSKRMFRSAPLHGHFRSKPRDDRWVNWPAEQWAETWIVQRFWIVGAVGALVGIWLGLAS